MMENENRATVVSLSMDWEELLREISLHAAYVVKGLPGRETETGTDPELEWVAGEDDAPLLKRLTGEAYGKLTTALRGYLLPEGSCRTEAGGMRLELRVVPENDLADRGMLRMLLLQAVAYYTLYRWFANRDGERSIWLLTLYEDALTEVKRLLHFRRGGTVRRTPWW